jgi:transposase
VQIYRDKDVVEKGFSDLKNQPDMKHSRMHSSGAANRWLFVQLIALIYVSTLHNEMRATSLIKQYIVPKLLQEMGTPTKIKYTGKYAYMFTELTKQQRKILKCLLIEPTSKT